MRAACMQQPVGEEMAALGVGRHLHFVDGQERHDAVERHGFDGADEIARAGRGDFLLAGDQRHLRGAFDLHDAIVVLARQQAQREADHARLVAEHALDGEVGLAGVGGTENGGQAAGGAGERHRADLRARLWPKQGRRCAVRPGEKGAGRQRPLEFDLVEEVFLPHLDGRRLAVPGGFGDVGFVGANDALRRLVGQRLQERGPGQACPISLSPPSRHRSAQERARGWSWRRGRVSSAWHCGWRGGRPCRGSCAREDRGPVMVRPSKVHVTFCQDSQLPTWASAANSRTGPPSFRGPSSKASTRLVLLVSWSSCMANVVATPIQSASMRRQSWVLSLRSGQLFVVGLRPVALLEERQGLGALQRQGEAIIEGADRVAAERRRHLLEQPHIGAEIVDLILVLLARDRTGSSSSFWRGGPRTNTRTWSSTISIGGSPGV